MTLANALGRWALDLPRSASRLPRGQEFLPLAGNTRPTPENNRAGSETPTRRAPTAHLALLSSAGKGEVVSKEVGEEERGARGGVDRRSDKATSVNVEADPHRRRLGRSQTDFALQAM
jgi:hypothetical protein